MYYTKMMSLIGELTILEEDNKITEILFEKEGIGENYLNKETEVLKEAKKQLQMYFNGQLKEFNLPLKIKGTEFQKKVYNALLNIPYGKTVSYKYIAKEIGNDKASRAVGGANNKNSIPIIIPCHRVIGTNNKLVGYAGGLDIKSKLLELETINKDQ